MTPTYQRHARLLAHRFFALLFILSQLAAALPPAYASAPLSSPPSPLAIDTSQLASSLAQSPLALSRVQTSYVAGETIVEFTLTNNLPTTRVPDVPDSATITETVDILADFVITDDVNTLHGLTLADTLAAGVTLLAASGDPVQTGNTLTWTLPDLPPQASTTLTISLQTPAQGTGFVNLDTGAQVSAERWGEPITATAPPAVLIPTGIDPAFTLPTVDADSRDADMLRESAALGQDALTMFAFVQGMGFDAYKGSLRGTRGTLWGEAGNAVDKSSLLIAMLRAAGVPARYRHGALDTADAQTLIASMFPAEPGIAGTLPAGTPVSDPLNDAGLLALVSDHWWVEAYLPGGWTNLDPSFPTAQPGDVFATPGGNDRIAELPADLRHTVRFTLEVEQYSQFPIGGSTLRRTNQLDEAFTTAELASKKILFSHLVDTEIEDGLVYQTTTHTFTPYIAVDAPDRLILGQAYQDVITNFPLGTIFTTGAWLTFEVTDADGQVETFTRPVKDLLGADVRLNGGSPNLVITPDAPPVFSGSDLFTTWILPNTVPAPRRQQMSGTLFPSMVIAAQKSQELDVLADLEEQGELTPEQIAASQDALFEIQLALANSLAFMGLDYAVQADETLAAIETGTHTRLVYDRPRVVTIASTYDQETDALAWNVDLRTTYAHALAAPGQATTAERTVNWLKGVTESYLEGETLTQILGQPALSTARVFDEMTLQGIPPLYLTPADAGSLALYALPADAKALMTTALNAGKHLLVPSAPVLVDGQSVTGWWQIDPNTGETIGVMENGLHNAAIEDLKFTVKITKNTYKQYKKIAKGLGDIYNIIAQRIQGATGGGTLAPIMGGSSWQYLPAHLCPVDNCGLEQFFTDLTGSPIPLPDMGFGYSDPAPTTGYAIANLPITGSGGNPAFSLTLTPGTTSIAPDETASFQATLDSTFDDTFTLALYAPEGWPVTVSAETLTARPAPGTPAGTYTLTVVAQPNAHPDLFETATLSVTVIGLDAVTLTLSPETNLTVPMGDAWVEDVSNQTNDGEAEIGGAAYTVELTNPGQTPHTFNVTVSGPPAGWVWLNGARNASASVALAAGETAKIGLYVQPPSGSVPAPGTLYPVNVSATSGSLSDSDSETFTVPFQPFNQLTTQPTILYLGSDSTADFSIAMTNVGNADGTFPIFASLPPITASVSGLPSPVSLVVGETQTFNATVNTSGLPLGARFPIILGSSAPGSYTQYAILTTQIISPLTEPVFIASDNAANACTLGEPGLSDALDALALAMVHLEASCLNGECNLSLRDQTVSAAYSVALYAGVISPGLVQDDAVLTAADELASHTDTADILTDLQNLSDAVAALDTEVCAWSDSMPDLTWSPYYNAALVNQPVTYTLNLENAGTLTTTYHLTVTLPSGTQTFNPTVNPGETSSYQFPASSPTIDLLDLEATVSVVGHPNVYEEATALLNVVDKFVQLTAVTPDPAFVETGVSATDISITVANNANILQPATAHLDILHASGMVSYTADVPVTILVGSLRAYALGTVDTSGWQTGVYTVSVQLLDGDQHPLDDGTGYGYLGVGQAVGISHAVEPGLVAPGAVTVTTVITTAILVDPLLVNQLSVDQLSITDQPITDQPITNYQSPISNLQSPFSTFPITRTENTSPTITYTGAWSTVTNIFASHTSGGSYTVSSTPGNTATFAFSGTWVQVGFSTHSNSGQAEIKVDGVSQGIVDLYTPGVICITSECLANFVFDGFTNTAHTLEIVVTGTSHPNAGGVEVRLDFIDTWDGTTYPDGTFEQDNPRIFRTTDWFQVSEAAASGGSYMNDGAVLNSGSVWFPFTGDSASFVALARYDTHRLSVWVDGVWQGHVLVYGGTAAQRVFSFTGFGPGPHVMRVGTYRGEPNIDAFITPAVGADYDPPAFTGIVRYEEDHPALTYNGYTLDKRPDTWSLGNAPQASDFSYIASSALGDTVSMTFTGSWLNIGLRTRNRGGLAEVFVDGVSLGTINAYTPNEDVVSYPFDVMTGTHTLTITVLDQSIPPNGFNDVYLDYIEFWDTTPITDTFQNALRAAELPRVHVSSAVSDGTHPNALEGDFVDSGLPNSNANIWYSFVGTAFTVYGLTISNGGTAEVYVDNVLVDTNSLDYPFSVQPYAFHYTGFDPGPHTVRVHNVDEMRVDGFAANPTALIPYQPIAEWWDNTPAGNGAPFFGTYGIAAGMAAGDLDGDGTVEIVVTADDSQNFGTLFVYRGDGADTGDGDPILWEHDFGGGVYRTWVSSPALADLDGQPGAEIVVAAGEQLFAFHADGSTYWITDTLDSIFETLTSPAIGNLDLDPEPEIVLNAGNALEVRAHTGELLWSTLYPAEVNPPILADLTGDGLLDILVTSWDDEVYLYDFNYGSPQLVWTATLGSSMSGTFGAPAVADVDGLLPGGDPGPEVAVSSNGLLTVLNGEDGSLVWDTPLDPGNPGGVSIADLDGDGEIEIVTGMRYEFETGRFGMLYALNADGSLLWDAIAEDSSSANNASVLDLDGDGIYEVAWNGKEQGFTIFNGLDGSVIFNEPLVNSFTGTDYPLIADVDNDGQAEIVSAALGGVRVFGYGSAWGPARPLWNQHSYHITNVNDDLTAPFSEPNSWEIHNTYRTQTPLVNPMPTYAVALTHTVGLDNVTVLTNTFNLPPSTSNPPAYGWDYAVTWETPVVTQTFTSLLTDLQPGETRMVVQSTTADYTVPGGSNHLELPPLFVSAAHILAVQPVTQTVGVGASAVFEVVLTNPSGVNALYTLAVSGFPAGWATLSGAVPVPAGSSVNVPLTVNVPLNADLTAYPFQVNATTDQGWVDQASGVLTVANLLELSIMPANQTVTTGEVATYTLSLTNADTVARTYTLSGSGLVPLTLPAEVTVPGNSTANISFTAQATSEGANPFTVLALEENGIAGGQATAAVTGEGFQQVEVAIIPATVPTGPGVLTPLDVRITNLGTVPDTYDLSASVPAGWDASLTMFGQPIETVTVAPGAGNTLTLQLFLTPASDAAPGDYDFIVTAQSLVSDAGAGVAQVGDLGVSVSLAGPTQVTGSGVWDVTVTNNGAAADTYDLTAFGPFAQFAQLSSASVTLAPGASQTVQLTASGFDFFLAVDYVLGVHAQSQTESYVQDEDALTVSILPVEGVVVAWQPASQTVNGTTQAMFTVVVSNTGNVQTAFDLTGSGTSGANVPLPVGAVVIPPHAAATFLVVVNAPGNGTYTLTLSANSGGAQGSGAATLVVEGVAPPVMEIYLPIIVRP